MRGKIVKDYSKSESIDVEEKKHWDNMDVLKMQMRNTLQMNKNIVCIKYCNRLLRHQVARYQDFINI